jgi:hypothetical protein
MSPPRSKSIAEEIEILARLTGAPSAFVEQVRALFTTKAISLDEAVEPFLPALEEAFHREQTIRSSSTETGRRVARIQENCGHARELCRDQADQHRRARAHLQSSARRIGEGGEKLDAAAFALGIRRGFQREVELDPIVPGPKEIQ